MWTPLPETSNDPLWEVVLEVEKNESYCHKGQEIKEIVQAPDRDSAVIKVCQANDISRVNVTAKGVRIWEG